MIPAPRRPDRVHRLQPAARQSRLRPRLRRPGGGGQPGLRAGAGVERARDPQRLHRGRDDPHRGPGAVRRRARSSAGSGRSRSGGSAPRDGGGRADRLPGHARGGAYITGTTIAVDGGADAWGLAELPRDDRAPGRCARCSAPPRWPSSAPPRTRASGATGWPAAPCAASRGGPPTWSTSAPTELLGRRAYASLAELPQAPDLVVIAVPVAALEDAVDAALAAGARAIVVISAGSNAGGGAAASMPPSAPRVRAAGAVLLGPNCLGVLDSGEQLELIPNPLPAGSIGLISQSGNLALELGLLAAPGGPRVLPLRVAGQPGRPRRRRAGARVRRPRRHRADRPLRRGLPRRARVRPRRRGGGRRRQAGAGAGDRATARPPRGRSAPTPARWPATAPRSTPPSGPPGS